MKFSFADCRRGWRSLASMLPLVCLQAGSSLGQHADIAAYQNVVGKLVAYDSTTAAANRVYVRSFDFFGHPFGNPGLPKAFVGDDPGVQMSGSDAPSEVLPLPAGQTLTFRVLPFQLPSGLSANLFHWSATSGPVAFGSRPAGHTVTITDTINATRILDGSVSTLADATFGVTDSLGGMHKHVSFRLDDGDGDVNTDPATGAYLFAIRLRMSGQTESDPLFVALTSPEVPSSTEADIATWLRDNLGSLLPLDVLRGDFDMNGVLNGADIDALTAQAVGGTHPAPFDLDGDGLVNAADVEIWIRDLYHTLPGDANLDRVVDGSDFGTWNANKFTSVAAWTRGDFSVDGVADGSDFNIWNSNKFRAADDAGMVPEPYWIPWIAMVVGGWLLRPALQPRS